MFKDFYNDIREWGVGTAIWNFRFNVALAVLPGKGRRRTVSVR